MRAISVTASGDAYASGDLAVLNSSADASTT